MVSSQIHPEVTATPCEVGTVLDGLLAGDCSRSESTENDLELHKFNMRTLSSHGTATSKVHRCQKPDTLTPCGQKPPF
jgi:hypothetical protein